MTATSPAWCQRNIISNFVSSNSSLEQLLPAPSLINRHLTKHSAMVVFLSTDGLRSPSVRRSAHTAWQGRTCAVRSSGRKAGRNSAQSTKPSSSSSASAISARTCLQWCRKIADVDQGLSAERSCRCIRTCLHFSRKTRYLGALLIRGFAARRLLRHCAGSGVQSSVWRWPADCWLHPLLLCSLPAGPLEVAADFCCGAAVVTHTVCAEAQLRVAQMQVGTMSQLTAYLASCSPLTLWTGPAPCFASRSRTPCGPGRRWRSRPPP